MDFLINRDRYSPISLNTYLMFTENCNFSCVYCYQKGQVCGKNISSEVLEDTLKWYEKILLRNNYKYCNVELYGGEPLLQAKKLIEFSSKLYNICEKNNIKLQLRLISNGYLLNSEIIKTLVNYGLRDIHISLDGWGKIHNQRRPLKNKEGSFERIINNILEIKDLCHLTIRTGFDKNNINSIENYLINISKILDFNYHSIYFSPIYETTEQVNNKCSYCSKNVVKNLDELIKNYKIIYSLLKKYNITLPSFVSSGPCMVFCADAVLIDTEGNLFKCVDMVGIDKLKIGSIYDDYNDNYYKFIKNKRFEKCIEKRCKYLSICGGGCVMKNYTLENDLTNINCEYKLFKELNEFLLDLK